MHLRTRSALPAHRAAHRWPYLLAFATVLGLSAAAVAQTGVSDDRVSLPEGPGSLEGVGDDASVNASMGQMGYTVPLTLPEGYSGFQPALTIAYNSGAGNGELGMGWSLSVPNVERRTVFGVPQYDLDDEFQAGGEQIVYVEGNNPRIYRARFESGFSRYLWHDAGDGSGGYWTIEYPDGRIGYFGASASGESVASSRVGDGSDVFRYHLVEMHDLWDHRIEYGYTERPATSLLTSIGWVFVDGSPIYAVDLAYEDRTDRVVDATGGFEHVLDRRLSEVAVSSNSAVIRRYALQYEDDVVSGGLTRLSGIQLFGLGDAQYPASHAFAYSASLIGSCSDCAGPYTFSMGSNGIDLRSGTASLIDINGDGLPDLVDTSNAASEHRIWTNVLDGEGNYTLVGPERSAIDGTRSSHDLTQTPVQVLDANGDGFTDMMNALTGEVLINEGTGDWARVEQLWLDGDAGISESELATARFMDYNNDRLIDLIRSEGAGDGNVTTVFRNSGSGFVAEVVDPLGAGFDSDAIELNDFNGDGLLDIVLVTETEIRYRLNLGWGHWSEGDGSIWRTAGSFTFSAQEATDAEVEDLNGDALSDLVLIRGSEVRIWLNINGEAFTDEIVLTSDVIAGTIPPQDDQTVVLFADMNGNGSTDIVWVEAGAAVTVLELYPVRPNLLTHVENGLGRVIDVTYGSSVEQMAAQGGVDAWQYRVPFPNLLVVEFDESDLLTEVHHIDQFTYSDGYYDGIEKTFRGFERVAQTTLGDDSREEARSELEFYVGAQDVYYNGRARQTDIFSNDRHLVREVTEYDDCGVGGIPEGADLAYPIRHICTTASHVERREGQTDASEWVISRQEFTTDEWGQTTLQADLGVIPGESGSCQACTVQGGEFGVACGSECLGDESYSESVFISPEDVYEAGGHWIVGLPSRSRSFGVPSSDVYAETLTYYDGDAFVGLAQGLATRGFESRTTVRVNLDGDIIEATRQRADEHGNVVETIDPTGTAGGDDHRRTYEMDATALFTTAINVHNTNRDGEPYELRKEYRYDPNWAQPVISTEWFVVDEANEELTARLSEVRTFDEFGRLVSVTPPGHAPSNPTQEFEYHVESPVGWVVEYRRIEPGAAREGHSIHCVDGRGRSFQERELIEAGSYLVSNYTTYNAVGEEWEVFDPYTSSSAACTDTPPPGTPSNVYTYDATDRPLRITSVFGDEVPFSRFEYDGLRTWRYDQNDTDPSSPWAETPTVTEVNGLGTTVGVGRVLEAGDDPEWYRYAFSSLGAVTRLTDPLGNERIQESDLLGRVVYAADADRGERTWRYDAEDNVVSETDANDVTILSEYDGLGRPLREWVDGDREATISETYYDYSEDCPEGHCQYGAGRIIGISYQTPLGQGMDWKSYNTIGGASRLLRLIDGQALEVATMYDQLGRITEVHFPGDRVITYERDLIGLITSVPGYVAELRKDIRGDIIAVDFANGTTLEHQYDALRRITSIGVTGSDGGDLVRLDYTFDNERTPLTVTDRATPSDLPSGSAALEYDAFYRLLSADLGGGTEVVTYTYDAADNILSRSSSLGEASPVHDGGRTLDTLRPHAVGSVGGAEYAYDQAGRVTAIGDTTFQWDGYGRMTGSAPATPGAGPTVIHGYADGPDRALTITDDGSVTYYLGDQFVIEDGVASIYLTLGQETIARLEYVDIAADVLSDVAPVTAAGIVTADGQINAADAWLAYASEQGLLDFSVSDASDADALLHSSAAQTLNAHDDRVTWLHRDHVDNLVAVTDAAGEVVERTHHFPFGTQRWSSSTAPEPNAFTDKRSDPSGLVFFGARFYDPASGRWTAPDLAFSVIDAEDLSADPWEVMGNYVYTGNGPTYAQDESGNTISDLTDQALGDVLNYFRSTDARVPSAGFGDYYYSEGNEGIRDAIGGMHRAGLLQEVPRTYAQAKQTIDFFVTANADAIRAEIVDRQWSFKLFGLIELNSDLRIFDDIVSIRRTRFQSEIRRMDLASLGQPRTQSQLTRQMAVDRRAEQHVRVRYGEWGVSQLQRETHRQRSEAGALPDFRAIGRDISRRSRKVRVYTPPHRRGGSGNNGGGHRAGGAPPG